MSTIPTDLLARLRAVLTAAEAMTPAPVAWSRYRDGVFIGIFEGPTDPRTVHDPGPRFEFRPLVEAPVSVPTWTVEPFGDGLTRHTITRGRVRLTVLAGYDDGMTHGEIAIVYGPGRDDVIRKSWFGGGNRTAEESLAEAKAGTLAMAREIGAVALVETPAPLTVGAAMADPRVQDGSHVVEYVDGGCYEQLRVTLNRGDRLHVRFRDATGEFSRAWTVGWIPAAPTATRYTYPCRLVPLADADRDPNERGPL